MGARPCLPPPPPPLPLTPPPLRLRALPLGSTFYLGLSIFAILFLSVLATLINNGYPYAGAATAAGSGCGPLLLLAAAACCGGLHADQRCHALAASSLNLQPHTRRRVV